MSTNSPFQDKDYYPTDDSRSLLNTENSDDLFTALRDCFATDGIDTTDYINPAILNTGVYSASTQCRPKPVPDPTNSHDFILPWLNVSQQFPIDMSESTQLPAGSESGTAANESYPICSMEVLRNNVGAVNGHSSRGKRSKSADPSSHSKIHRLKKRRRYGGAKKKEIHGDQNATPALSKVASAGCSHWLRSYRRRPTDKEVHGLQLAYNASSELISLWFKCQADIDRTVRQKCKRTSASGEALRQIPKRDEKQLYVCTSLCGKVLKTKDEWKRHEETHFPQRALAMFHWRLSEKAQGQVHQLSERSLQEPSP